MKRPRFQVTSTDAGWHFTLVAPNGEIVATSETYPDVRSAHKGLAAVKRYALLARVEES